MKNSINIFCDFDGIISQEDTLFTLLSMYAEKKWQEYEEDWKKGKISTKECLQEQIKLFPKIKEKLFQYIDNVEIDKGFCSFVTFLRNNSIPLKILSDGIDIFIRNVLKRNDLENIPVVSNSMDFETFPYKMIFPYFNPCHPLCAVCKGEIIKKAKGAYKIHIGDGFSDRCAAREADFVFAKGKLADFCEEEKISYLRFENFNDILSVMKTQFI